MNPVVYLHLGAFKTGTSAVQSVLFGNRERLLADSGILVPQAFSRINTTDVHSSAHHLLVHRTKSALNEGQTEQLQAAARELHEEIEASGAETVILSSEMLGNTSPKVLRRIMGILDGYTVRVVMVLRRVDEFIDSMRKQEVKSLLVPIARPEKSPFRMLWWWQEQLPKESIHVMLYGYPSRSAMVGRVLRALSIPDPDGLAKDNGIRNPSITLNGCVLSYYLRAAFPERSRKRNRNLIQRVSRFESICGEPVPFSTVDRSERIALLDRFRDEHERMGSEFLTEPERRPFANPEGVPEVDNDLLKPFPESIIAKVTDFVAADKRLWPPGVEEVTPSLVREMVESVARFTATE